MKTFNAGDLVFFNYNKINEYTKNRWNSAVQDNIATIIATHGNYYRVAIKLNDFDIYGAFSDGKFTDNMPLKEEDIVCKVENIDSLHFRFIYMNREYSGYVNDGLLFNSSDQFVLKNGPTYIVYRDGNNVFKSCNDADHVHNTTDSLLDDIYNSLGE